ncbi:hypothetical protein O5541_01685 [Escherichia coli]|nr:hypothetical protein [Escherichia coli]
MNALPQARVPAAGIVMVILGFELSDKISFTGDQCNDNSNKQPLRAEIFGRQECLPIYHLIWRINNKSAPVPLIRIKIILLIANRHIPGDQAQS